MTFLLTFLLLLMGGGTAGADIDTVRVCLTNGHCDTLTKAEFSQEFVAAFWPQRECLAKMEAAMKAMEPFQILSWFKIENKFVATRHAITAQEHDKMADAIDQWDATKKDCWSKP